MFRVFAVLPAAGSGQRFKSYLPKQYCLLGDKPVISYTIQCFEKLPWMEKIIVVVSVDEFETMRKIIKDHKHTDKVVLVPGEASRHGSIYNGIKYMSSGHVETPPDVVIVHDAVRMFLTDQDLNTVAMEAFKCGAAGYIRPLVSTVVVKDKEGFLAEVFDRSRCHGSETPQAFKYEVIKEAYESASKQELDKGTECLLLVQRHTLGSRVKLIEGEEHLWKITHQKDLYAAQGCLKGLIHTILFALVSFNTGSRLASYMDPFRFTENSSHMVFVGSSENSWRNLLHAVTKSKDSCVCDSVSGIPKNTIRNVILCYTSFKLTNIKSDSKKCLDYFSDNCMYNCTIIYVVTTSSSSDVESLRTFLDSIQKPLEQKSVVCYGICAKHDPMVNKIGNTISSVIRDRNKDLSGQVFTL